MINVSNAPPFSLSKQKGTRDWQIKQGSGGLVSCVDPVMSKDNENVWLANLGMNINESAAKHRRDSPQMLMTPTTNTLGLPLIKQSGAEVLFHVLEDEDTFGDAAIDPRTKTARYCSSFVSH